MMQSAKAHCTRCRKVSLILVKLDYPIIGTLRVKGVCHHCKNAEAKARADLRSFARKCEAQKIRRARERAENGDPVGI